jgi:hypothetical protein
MRSGVVRWRLLGLVVVCGLVLGCTRGPAANDSQSPEPTRPTATEPGVSENPSDCYNLQLLGTPDQPTIERLSKRSPVVLDATFKGYGTPFWDTSDARRPTPEDVNSGAAQILTPVELDVTDALKGEAQGAGRVVVWGGEIGCDRFTTDQVPDIVAGSRYVIFLLPQTKPEGPTGNSWIVAAWPVNAKEEVETPLDGPRSLAQLKAEILTGKVEATPTPGVEPSESYP